MRRVPLLLLSLLALFSVLGTSDGDISPQFRIGRECLCADNLIGKEEEETGPSFGASGESPGTQGALISPTGKARGPSL